MNITAAKFNDISSTASGLVIVGCDISTEENRQRFITGVTEFLQEQGAVESSDPKDNWQSVQACTTTGGRNDLVFTFKSDVNMNMGRLAIVRLQMPGPAKWISDWKDNFADQYGAEPAFGNWLD